MHNAEEVLQCLEEFSKCKIKLIPPELDNYLAYVALTGDPVYQWPVVKTLYREKLINVITDFNETTPGADILPYPNVDSFDYATMKERLLERLDSFVAAPFTVQRISELLICPRKQYKRIDKFMRAVEKNILVVSVREPGVQHQVEQDNNESEDSMVNGSGTNDSLDVEMEDVDFDSKVEPKSLENPDSPEQSKVEKKDEEQITLPEQGVSEEPPAKISKSIIKDIGNKTETKEFVSNHKSDLIHMGTESKETTENSALVLPKVVFDVDDMIENKKLTEKKSLDIGLEIKSEKHHDIEKENKEKDAEDCIELKGDTSISSAAEETKIEATSQLSSERAEPSEINGNSLKTEQKEIVDNNKEYCTDNKIEEVNSTAENSEKPDIISAEKMDIALNEPSIAPLSERADGNLNQIDKSPVHVKSDDNNITITPDVIQSNTLPNDPETEDADNIDLGIEVQKNESSSE